MGRSCFTALVLATALGGLRTAAEGLPGSEAVKSCTPVVDTMTLATETASAGYLSNLTNRSGSIRATSKRMLMSAIESSRSKDPAQRVIFTSTPVLSKKAHDDDAMCARYEQITNEDPLRFEDKHFDTVNDLTTWIMDFTQGKGGDGESLYRQCPGKCSPRYTWWIEPEKAGMKVQARVVCGLPRDRDGDLYELTTALAAPCTAEPKP
jgi:hypothetical protein